MPGIADELAHPAQRLALDVARRLGSDREVDVVARGEEIADHADLESRAADEAEPAGTGLGEALVEHPRRVLEHVVGGRRRPPGRLAANSARVSSSIGGWPSRAWSKLVHASAISRPAWARTSLRGASRASELTRAACQGCSFAADIVKGMASTANLVVPRGARQPGSVPAGPPRRARAARARADRARASSSPPTRGSTARSPRRSRRSRGPPPEGNRYPDGGCYALRPALAEQPRARSRADRRRATAPTRCSTTSRSRCSSPGTRSRSAGRRSPCTRSTRPRWARSRCARRLRAAATTSTALAACVGPRTKIVYVTNPNNPTGGMVGRDALARFLDGLPEHVLPVLDEAYHEYVDDPDYPDGAARAPARRPPRRGAAHVLEDLRARRACASAGARCPSTWPRRWTRSRTPSTSASRRRTPPGRASARSARSRDGPPRPASGASACSQDSSRSDCEPLPAVANFVSVLRRRRQRGGHLARAARPHRPAARRLRRPRPRSASAWACRTRSSWPCGCSQRVLDPG